MATEQPVYPIPPRAFLGEEMVTRGLTPPELAMQLGVSLDDLTRIFDGDCALDDALAHRLEAAFVIDAGIWLGLEREYRSQLRQLEEQPEEYRAEIVRAMWHARPPIDAPSWPGRLLAEELEGRGIAPIEAAGSLGMDIDTLMDLLDGITPLTAGVAERIEAYLGSPRHLWLGLEEDYRAALTKKQALDAEQQARTG